MSTFFFQKALSERFKMDSQHIDLSSFYHEPKLRDHRVKLDYAYHAYIVAKIIVQNIPSVSVLPLNRFFLTLPMLCYHLN